MPLKKQQGREQPRSGKGRRKRPGEFLPKAEPLAKLDFLNYEKAGKRQKLKKKRPGKRLEIAGQGGLKLVKRQRKELAAKAVEVNGKCYVRAHEEGKGRGQESLLRHGGNLSNMVSEVQRLAREKAREGRLPSGEFGLDYEASKGPLAFMQGVCTEPGAIDASLFVTTKGQQMRGNVAFFMLVRQFFRDIDFAARVIADAARQERERMEKKPLEFPAKPSMATVSVSVDGVSYTRSFPTGNRLAEAVVRRNLERFIRGVFEAVGAAKEQGRTSHDVEKYCHPPEGTMRMHEFEMPDGKPIKDEKLFRAAISQFFYDSEMARKAIAQALARLEG